MVTTLETLKYTKNTLTVVTYDTGITDWEGILDAYRNQPLRNKVVCRLDACQFLSMYFTPEFVKKYRPVIMMIMKAQVTDATQFSNVIKDMMQQDSRFKEKLHDIYYSCPEEVSFGSHIIQTLANVLRSTEERYRSFFRHRPEVVICISDGYLYFSVDDDTYLPELPDKVDCEVISYAKSWNGVYRFGNEKVQCNLVFR